MLSVTEDNSTTCSKTALKTCIPQIKQKSIKQYGIQKTAFNSYKVKWLNVIAYE